MRHCFQGLFLPSLGRREVYDFRALSKMLGVRAPVAALSFFAFFTVDVLPWQDFFAVCPTFSAICVYVHLEICSAVDLQLWRREFLGEYQEESLLPSSGYVPFRISMQCCGLICWQSWRSSCGCLLGIVLRIGVL